MSAQPSKDLYQSAYARAYDEHWEEVAGGDINAYLIETIRELAPKAKTWMDMYCGNGRTLQAGSAAGFQMSGLDIAAKQIEIARHYCPAAKLICSDFPDEPLNEKYDVVTWLGGSSNSCASLEAFAKAVKAQCVLLADANSLFIFDTNSLFSLEENDGGTHAWVGETDTLVVQTSFDKSKRCATWHAKVFEKTEGNQYICHEESHPLYGYPRKQIENILSELGLSFEVLDGHYMTKPDEETYRLLYICKKA